MLESPGPKAGMGGWTDPGLDSSKDGRTTWWLRPYTVGLPWMGKGVSPGRKWEVVVKRDGFKRHELALAAGLTGAWERGCAEMASWPLNTAQA